VKQFAQGPGFPAKDVNKVTRIHPITSA
jgi:hypothetical protein